LYSLATIEIEKRTLEEEKERVFLKGRAGLTV